MQRTRTIISVLTLSFALTSVAACGKSEVDSKPKAKVEEAGKVEPKPEAGAEAGAEPKAEAMTLNLATEGSKIGFIGAKVTGDHKGSFAKFKGTATVEGDKLSGMDISVEVGSLTSDDEKLTGHLLSVDFFEVEQYPEAKFTTLSVTEKAGEGGATHEVVGNLELKGQAKKITFPATIHVADGSVHGTAAFSIDRKLWGITYAGMPDDLIKDDVALELELKFPKA
jgi:polyisoprenoid-binding protein YceI